MARSISDEEIGLIKALLARGERNVDIQFYFNRQDRPANSGRISQIRNGTYGPEIPEASEEELNAFLENFQTAQIGVAIEGGDVQAHPPTIADRAKERFEQRTDGNWYLREGETSQQECKQSFDPNRMNPVVKAIAALSNNRGGFIFFGIEDTQCQVIGMPDTVFQDTDIVQISQNVKKFLTPTPDFTKIVVDLGGVSVGVIYVEKYGEPPVIVGRDGDGLDSGTILFRSPGQSAKISAGDLLILLRERDQASQTKLLKSAQRVAEIGLNNSLIVDTRAGTIEAEDTRVTIDRGLADQLEFIREGEFEEVEGAPALRLIGDVRAVDPDGEIQERIENRALTADSVLEAFLRNEDVRSPLEFVRESALVQRQWLPLFYFAELSGQSIDEVSVALNETEAVYSISKANALERLSGHRSAYTEAAGQAAPVLQMILGGELNDLEQLHEDRVIARALLGLPDGYENFQPIFELLQRLFGRIDGNSSLKGALFKASARLDELAYRE